MNCLREEDFLSACAVHPDATPLQAHSRPQTGASKLMSLFRSRRRQQEKSAAIFDSEGPNNQSTAKFYSAIDTSSRQFRGHDLADNAQVPFVSRMNISTVSTGSGLQIDGRGIRSNVNEFSPMQSGGFTNQLVVSHESFATPDSAVFAQKHGLAAQPEVRFRTSPKPDVVNQSDVFRVTDIHPEEKSVTLPTFSHFQKQTGSDSPRYRAPGRRRAQGQFPLPSLSPVASTEDGAPSDSQLHFRRKSLPSIVKGPDSVLPPPARREPNPNQSTTPTSGRGPEVKAGIAEPETIVIEDGVRKRVTPVYGPGSPVRALAVGGRAGLPKLYRIETTGTHGRGSVPDLTDAALEGVDVPSIEVVYALTQQRRDELTRERIDADKRKSGQIILRLGDVKVTYFYV